MMLDCPQAKGKLKETDGLLWTCMLSSRLFVCWSSSYPIVAKGIHTQIGFEHLESSHLVLTGLICVVSNHIYLV